MAVSLGDLLAAMQNGVTAINNLNIALQAIFPQATATSSGVPSAGGISFNSSQAATFITVQTSSGGTYQVPGY